MYKICIKHRGDVKSEYSVSSSRVLIGSAEDCDIVLDAERKVEPRHALLEADDSGQWSISPVDGHEIVSRGESIAVGHQLVLGHTFLVGEFVVSWEDETEPELNSDVYDEVTLPVAETPRFRMLTGAQSGKLINIEFDFSEKPALIGRDAEACDIVLLDRSISRRHAQLREDETGFVLEDVGSTNGLRSPNGEVVYHLLIHNGMCFSIGDVEILFECPLKAMGNEDSTAPHMAAYVPTRRMDASEQADYADPSYSAATKRQDAMNPAMKPLMFLVILLILAIVFVGVVFFLKYY